MHACVILTRADLHAIESQSHNYIESETSSHHRPHAEQQELPPLQGPLHGAAADVHDLGERVDGKPFTHEFFRQILDRRRSHCADGDETEPTAIGISQSKICT